MQALITAYLCHSCSHRVPFTFRPVAPLTVSSRTTPFNWFIQLHVFSFYRLTKRHGYESRNPGQDQSRLRVPTCYCERTCQRFPHAAKQRRQVVVHLYAQTSGLSLSRMCSSKLKFITLWCVQDPAGQPSATPPPI